MYHHFPSKEALFHAVFEAVEDDMCAELLRVAGSADDPVEMLCRGARAFLVAAATPEVRRVVLLDGPAVLSVETRRALSERYGLGLVRGGLLDVERAGRLRVGPVDVLAPLLLAAMHEAATLVADGGDFDALAAVVDDLVRAITR